MIGEVHTSRRIKSAHDLRLKNFVPSAQPMGCGLSTPRVSCHLESPSGSKPAVKTPTEMSPAPSSSSGSGFRERRPCPSQALLNVNGELADMFDRVMEGSFKQDSDHASQPRLADHYQSFQAEAQKYAGNLTCNTASVSPALLRQGDGDSLCDNCTPPKMRRAAQGRTPPRMIRPLRSPSATPPRRLAPYQPEDEMDGGKVDEDMLALSMSMTSPPQESAVTPSIARRPSP